MNNLKIIGNIYERIKKPFVAFDVDDTLIVPSCATGFAYDTPNIENIALFRTFEAMGCNMVIWSGGGEDYARMWAEKLGLKAIILKKQKNDTIDICFDDCVVDLAKVNFQVKRRKNSISRKKEKVVH